MIGLSFDFRRMKGLKMTDLRVSVGHFVFHRK